MSQHRREFSEGRSDRCMLPRVVLVVKNLPANVGDLRDTGSIPDLGLIPGSGRSPGEGHGNPPEYSCLENPMDGGRLQSMAGYSP